MRRLLPRPVTDDQLTVALATSDPTLSLIVHLMAFAGLRCMEVAALAVDDVSVDLGVLRITGKGGHERIVPLHPDLRLASAETQCTGKRRFSSRKLAKRHLRLVQGVGIRAAVHDMTEYQCPHCGWWHVGGRLRSPSSSVRA